MFNLFTFCSLAFARPRTALAPTWSARGADAARCSPTRLVEAPDGGQLPRPGSMKAAMKELGTLPYGEESRRYRRTVFRHEDWLKHRSSTRLFKNLKGTFTSGVVRSLALEVGSVTAVGLVIIAWNSALFGYDDFLDAHHSGVFGPLPEYLKMQLPAFPFTLSSSALGLLLVFRTNASYGRWLEARTAWGRIVSHSRNVLRQGCVWLDADCDEAARDAALDALAIRVWAFPRSLKAHLSGPPDEACFAEELRQRLGEPRAQLLLGAPNRPVRALRDLGDAIVALPMDEKRRVEMDKSVILLGDACETCERLFASPVPLVYTRHTARFLSSWLLLLPLALWEPFHDSWNHFALVPATALLAIFLFGIEELAVQLEEPFSILPLAVLCDSVREAAEDTRRRE